MRLFAAAFLLGTALLQREAALPEFPVLLAGAAVVLAAFLFRSIPRAALLACGALLLGYGYAGWRAQSQLADALPFAREGVDVTVSGVIASLPQETARGTRFVFDVERGVDVPAVIALAWYADVNAAPPPLA